MTGKRNSIIILILFEVLFAVLLSVVCADFYRNQKALRLNKLQSDSYLLGEWIRDSYTASGYLLKSILSIIPAEEVYSPPDDTQIYSDGRERVHLLRSSFPHAHLAGIVDERGILTHSLYHDGLDMKDYDFYEELQNSPPGSFLLSDAFQMKDGEWVVCHALKYNEQEGNVAAVMMIDLEIFHNWLIRLESVNAESVIVADRNGHVLAGGCNGTCEERIGDLAYLLNEESPSGKNFRLLDDSSGNRYALQRIKGLPYSVLFLNPGIVSLPELLLSLLIIIIVYISVFFLGIMVFRSHLSQINLNIELEETSTEMTAIFENAMVGIIMLDEDYRIRLANSRFAELLGYDSADEVSGVHISEFHTSFESFRSFVKYYREEIKDKSIIKLEYEFRRRDGSFLWASIVGKPLENKNKSGSLNKEIWIAEDISDRRAAEEKLKELAATDPMTGIANRRRFMDYGEREYAIYLRHKRSLSVVMLDIDHFKAVNDIFGHAVGDRAIILAVEICAKSLRAGDLFGRLGGEEFALILPDTDMTAAYLVAERIRGMIEMETKDRNDGIPHFTVSLGVAEASEDSFDLLLQRADQALYNAKESGRNLVYRLEADNRL